MTQRARGSYVSAEEFNSLAEEVNQLRGILTTLGPGLELVGGRGLGVNLGRILFANPDGPRKVLAATQGVQDTDTWAVETDGRDDGNGFEVQLITDAKYDTTTHLFTARMRTLKVDKYGRAVAVTGEGSAVTIFTAETC